jgi:thioredoxin reductase (NADPH)
MNNQILGPTIKARRDQMFPTLTREEIARLRHFGETRRYPKGEYMARAGTESPGLHVVLAGEVSISLHDALGEAEPFVDYGPGSFMAEIGVLSGRPALVDGIAKTEVEALLIPVRRLREVMVEEAELGERIMRALILRRVALIESGHTGPIIVGHAGDANVLRLAGWLQRNSYPHRHLDPDTDADAKALLDRFHAGPHDLPIVLCPAGEMQRNPTEHQLARCLGMLRPLDSGRIYDVAIVGGGPAGLAAAVYGASEGLSMIILDSRAFGGQAGASMRIENYLGFPTGITGQALMARAYNQAQKFGVDTAIPEEAVRLGRENGVYVLDTPAKEHARARAVVIASGARYRKLDVPNLAQYEGSHVHYWASPIEGRLCANEEVALVGAGNSAGQAAVYLASVAKKVVMLVRGKSLEATMSQYLVERIAAHANIEVRVESEVIALEGSNGALETIRWRDRKTGAETSRAVRHLFLFIGADPNTDWLKPCGITLDDKGFVLTADQIGPDRAQHETSAPGVFAIGDVRCGSVKRVAAAVGEGAQVVAAIHAYLAKLHGTEAKPAAR